MMHVKIEDLKLGMILAKPVFNHQELLLLEAGVKISEKNIRMFKSWGVSAVWVRGDSCAVENAEDLTSQNHHLKLFEAEQEKKFADVLDDPIMLEIMRAASRVMRTHIRETDGEK